MWPLSKSQMILVAEMYKVIPKIHMEIQGIQNSYPEMEEWNCLHCRQILYPLSH